MTDPYPEPANEADVLEQRLGLRPDDDDEEVSGPLDAAEADPADVHEQRLAVPDDEEHHAGPT